MLGLGCRLHPFSHVGKQLHFKGTKKFAFKLQIITSILYKVTNNLLKNYYK
jgi:hypothetical protein